jgi:phosphoglycerate dehydrogenase-like enzyme
MPSKPLVLLDPFPRRVADILRPERLAELAAVAELVVHDDGLGPMPDGIVDAHLPDAALLLGQTALPAERLGRAANLRGVINVETNFLPNIDYERCFERGIHVLTPGSAFAPVVAEIALGMAIDLARGITAADRDFRDGHERWGLEGNEGAFTLRGASVGLIGFGDLGRALLPLLAPFDCTIRAYDPWLPDYLLHRHGVEPAPLDALLRQSRVVFVFAGVSTENRNFLGRDQFALMQAGSVFLLLSRAAVVDFPAMVEAAASGRIRVGTDVFPVEPAAPDDPVRRVPNLLLSAHRAGALPEALLDIGDQAVADALLMLRGLPPAVCRRAQRETVGRSRSAPISRS